MKGPQVGIMFISGWGTYVWFWNELEAWQRWVQVHLIKECFWHTFGTQVEDQDQHQDEDKDQILVSIEDHLEERKELKEWFKIAFSRRV